LIAAATTGIVDSHFLYNLTSTFPTSIFFFGVLAPQISER